MEAQPITYWNRRLGREETELVYGENWVQMIYGTRLGNVLADLFLSRKVVSRALGAYQDSAASMRAIEPFISRYQIKMEDFESGPFRSFNDFFARKFRPGARAWEKGPEMMPAFAEARYLGFAGVSKNQRLTVKGAQLDLPALFGPHHDFPIFEGGPALIARLCPTDYHRFHYPDSGNTRQEYREHGKLHSVNPTALAARPEALFQNERCISILEMDHFGTLAYIEVGALCVGKIVETHLPTNPFSRGDEKGYFLFGGSTVIVLGEPGKWVPEQDILEHTARGQEVFVQLGDRVATR